MSDKTELQKVSEETMRFMRGKYLFDEVSHSRDKLEFHENGEAVIFIRMHEDRYDFHIDGKCIPVADLETLEAIKQMIMTKKRPNRKPFPKEHAVYSDCGHRCDLCVHYTGKTVSEEFRKEMQERVRRVYGLGPDEEFPPCKGCSNGGITGKFDCEQIKCAKDKGAVRCIDCAEYDCGKATAGWKPAIEARSISADDVTWAILPYVDGQYGN